MSSFAVIGVILVASLTVPANALSNIHYVWDYFDNQFEENGDLHYQFTFREIPTYYVLTNSGGGAIEGYPPLEISNNPGYTYVQIHAWPLGVKNWNGANCSGGVLAVSDFSRFTTFHLSTSVFLTYKYSGTANNGNTYSFTTVANLYLFYYDASGTFLGVERSEDYTKTESFTVVNNGLVKDETGFAMGATMDVHMPADTAYICPMLKCQFNLPYQGSDFVYEVKTDADSFVLRCAANAIIENTETLNRIEDKLAELNDKSDTLISGTPGMKEDVQNSSDMIQDQSEALKQAEELEMEYLDDFEESSNSLNNMITTIVDGKGFVQLSSLVTPIMNWQHTGPMMLLLIAFINMSVVLFGR